MRCRLAAGPTGCWAITTSRESLRRVGAAQARVAAMLLLTLRGTPTMYYGDEIGLARVDIPPERMQDPMGEKTSLASASAAIHRGRRRQWNSSANAGFTAAARRGCPLNSALSQRRTLRNCAWITQSILWLYRRLIDIRRQHRALSIGDAPGDLPRITMC